MSAALASASARPSGGVASRSPNPRAPGRQTLPSSKTPCFETRKTRRTSNAPPSALPPTSVPKLKQQLARSRVTPPADEAETRAGATGSNTGSTGSTVSSKKLSRWKTIARLMESEGASELYGASRINTYATSERYDLSTLASTLRSRAEMWHAPEALDDETVSTRLRNPRSTSSDGGGSTDRGADDVKMAFFFEYGIVGSGFDRGRGGFATRDLLESCKIDPFAADDVEVDAMFFAHADPETHVHSPSGSSDRRRAPVSAQVDERRRSSPWRSRRGRRRVDATLGCARRGGGRRGGHSARAGGRRGGDASGEPRPRRAPSWLCTSEDAFGGRDGVHPTADAATGETSLSAREATMLRGRVFYSARTNVARRLTRRRSCGKRPTVRAVVRRDPRVFGSGAKLKC